MLKRSIEHGDDLPMMYLSSTILKTIMRGIQKNLGAAAMDTTTLPLIQLTHYLQKMIKEIA